MYIQSFGIKYTGIGSNVKDSYSVHLAWGTGIWRVNQSAVLTLK